MNEPRLELGDDIVADWGVYGTDPRWPQRVTARLFRRNERGERLIVDEMPYERIPLDAVVVTEEALARALEDSNATVYQDGVSLYDYEAAVAILAALREGER